MFQYVHVCMLCVDAGELFGEDGPMHITIDTPYHTINRYLMNASQELGVNVSLNYNQQKNMFGKWYVQIYCYIIIAFTRIEGSVIINVSYR